MRSIRLDRAFFKILYSDCFIISTPVILNTLVDRKKFNAFIVGLDALSVQVSCDHAPN